MTDTIPIIGLMLGLMLIEFGAFMAVLQRVSEAARKDREERDAMRRQRDHAQSALQGAQERADATMARLQVVVRENRELRRRISE